MSCGIYKITNIINGHSYIGQSIDIERRWKEHQNMKYKASIYDAFKKYGLENFSFEIIEECPKEKLLEKEKYWIAFYDTYNNGYNMTEGGEGGPMSGRRRAVAQYDQNGDFIAAYESITQAEKELGIQNSNITRVCKGEAYEAAGYQWRYLDDNFNYILNIGKSPLKERRQFGAYCTSHRERTDLIKVAQCDKNTHEIIKIFNSIKEASEQTGTYISNIYRVIRNKRKSAGGYYWIEYK